MVQDEQKKDRKETIFEAAVRCFNENGYYETSIDTIAARAQISKGGIYYHFKSKKDLFLELFQYRVTKYFDQLKAYIQEVDEPEERLQLFITKASRLLQENGDFFRFCIEFLSMGVREPEIRDVMTDFYKDSVTTFTQLISEGVEKGSFKDLGSEKVARTIYFLFMGVFFTYYSVNVDFDLIDQHTFHINNIIDALQIRK